MGHGAICGHLSCCHHQNNHGPDNVVDGAVMRHHETSYDGHDPETTVGVEMEEHVCGLRIMNSEEADGIDSHMMSAVEKQWIGRDP